MIYGPHLAGFFTLLSYIILVNNNQFSGLIEKFLIALIVLSFYAVLYYLTNKKISTLSSQ
jgi:hypothetical protein